jgi:hypothetical protein
MKMLTAELGKLDHGAPWRDREVARRCKVDNKTVARLRDELSFQDDAYLRKSSDNVRTVTAPARPTLKVPHRSASVRRPSRQSRQRST